MGDRNYFQKLKKNIGLVKKIIKNLLTNKLTLFLRNNLNIKPLGYTYLKKMLFQSAIFFIGIQVMVIILK